MVTPNPDIMTDPEYLRILKLREEVDQAIANNAKFGYATSSEGGAATFYGQKDLQTIRDNYTTQLNRRAQEITAEAAEDENWDADFAQSVVLQLPRY